LRKASVAVASRVRWTAGADGIAHAHRALWPGRTACALRGISEQWAHPERSRCATCLAVLEAEGIAA